MYKYADKYYMMAPFQYAANNPTRFIDVNGDSIWVNIFENNKLERLHFGANANGWYGLMRKDGSFYDGKDAFAKQVGSALERLRVGEAGKNLVDFIANHAEGVTIAAASVNQTYYESNSIAWNPNSTMPIPTEKGIETVHNQFISLGHEMGHIEDHLLGTLVAGTLPPAHLPESDKWATHRENQLRAENGFPLRTHYGVIGPDSYGKYAPDTSTRLIDSAGNSVYGPTTVTPATATAPAATRPYNYKTGK